MRLIFTFLLVLYATAFALTKEDSTSTNLNLRSYTASKISNTPNIDGKLDDDCWINDGRAREII